MDHARERRKRRVALLSVSSNSLLVVLKLTVGLLIGSVSVISEAVHSAVDLVAAVIAFLAVRTSSKPADQGHPFGHGKVENISGVVEALLIFAAAGVIIVEAVRKLLHPEPLETVGWGVGVMAVSAVVNLIVSRRLFTVGRETESVALQADGWHLRTDVYTSIGVSVGLALIWLGGRLMPGTSLAWLDPVAALAVAVLIMKTAYDLTVHAARDLLDTSLPADEEDLIGQEVTAFAPEVRGFHRLRTRKAGSHRFVDFHLLVQADMTVEASHDIAEVIAGRIEARFPQSSVSVHVEPCAGECVDVCLEGCLIDEQERTHLHGPARDRQRSDDQGHDRA